MEKWIPLISILFSSALVLEIFKLIVAGVKARRAKKQNIQSMPERLSAIDKKVDDLAASTAKGLADINRKLDSDTKHFHGVDASLEKLTQAVNLNAEGTALGLENDLIIFNAFRDHHINGESEKAEKKVREYLMRNTTEALKAN